MDEIKRLFLGIDKESYELIRPEVNKSNSLNLLIFSSITFLVMVILGVASIFTTGVLSDPINYLSVACASALIITVNIITRDKETKQSKATTLTCIVFNLMLLSFGIALSVNDSPNTTSTIFPTLLLATPLLFALKPQFNAFITIFMTISSLVMEYLTKSSTTFQIDLANICSIAIVSIILGAVVSDTKFNRILTDKTNDELMEKIKSDSVTDSLTGLNNRNAYEANFTKYPVVPETRDFVYVSIDLNGLKVANDTKGHAAGDELIKGCADCMRKAFTGYGNLFRVGGDEFVAALFVSPAKWKELKEEFDLIVDEWSGDLTDSLSVAVGAASNRDNPGMNVSDLSKLADKLMYADKNNFYKSKGVDRKGRQEAHTVLTNLYTKIFRINLKEDTFQIINIDDIEKAPDKGFSLSLSEWLKDFADKGNVHPDDKDEYLKKTDYDFIRDYFTKPNKTLNIHYRRKYKDDFKLSMMELIPVDTYSEFNQELFLYVKEIET